MVFAQELLGITDSGLRLSAILKGKLALRFGILFVQASNLMLHSSIALRATAPGVGVEMQILRRCLA